jgi:putative RecB family exonuclease
VPEYRSVSQVNELERCSYAYYLGRIERVWKKPAAWLAQGTAVHEAAELWEKSGRTMPVEQALDVFREAYQREINKSAEDTPNWHYWERSGPYSCPADVERRYGIGLTQTEAYLQYYTDIPEERPWVSPDGLAVELAFTVMFGDIQVRGLIDMVLENGRPRDNKTGKSPGDDFQLATYAGILNVKYDIPFTSGDYWMAQLSGPTRPYDLTGWSVDRLADVYGEADRKIRAEEFTPNPSTKVCMFCSVRSSCEYAMG